MSRCLTHTHTLTHTHRHTLTLTLLSESYEQMFNTHTHTHTDTQTHTSLSESYEQMFNTHTHTHTHTHTSLSESYEQMFTHTHTHTHTHAAAGFLSSPGFSTQSFDLVLLDELTPPQLIDLSVQITHVPHDGSHTHTHTQITRRGGGGETCGRHYQTLNIYCSYYSLICKDNYERHKVL